eukprot:1242437-Amorphochlora_amoeboformis.AAC.1
MALTNSDLIAVNTIDFFGPSFTSPAEELSISSASFNLELPSPGIFFPINGKRSPEAPEILQKLPQSFSSIPSSPAGSPIDFKSATPPAAQAKPRVRWNKGPSRATAMDESPASALRTAMCAAYSSRNVDGACCPVAESGASGPVAEGE